MPLNMPANWPTPVSGVVTQITTALDFGYRFVPYEKSAGKSACDILKQVDDVLQNTNVVLENHKEFFLPEEFKELKLAYCRYHWQMTNEAQADRANTDKLIRQSRILSQLYANRQPHAERARDLLNQVEVYQSRVLSASRNAQPPDSLTLFEDEISETTTQIRATIPNIDASPNQSYTSWFSVLGRSNRPGSASALDSGGAAVDSETDAKHSVEGRGFIISVTHFPKPASAPGSGGNEPVIAAGSNLYRRMIAFENTEKRIEIIDPKLYALKGNETYIPESTLLAMSDLGQNLLNQSESDASEDSLGASDGNLNALLETTVQRLKKTSLNSE